MLWRAVVAVTGTVIRALWLTSPAGTWTVLPVTSTVPVPETWMVSQSPIRIESEALPDTGAAAAGEATGRRATATISHRRLWNRRMEHLAFRASRTARREGVSRRILR